MDIACLAPSDDMDYAPIFERVLTNAAPDASVATFYPHNGDMPDSYDFDRVVITGSEFHVYDRQNWVGALQDYVLDALDRDIPVLGVCYGHQLLADALGGTVAQLDVSSQAPLDSREMGFNPITVTDAGNDSVLLGDFPSPFRSFTSHMDYVAELPATATELATNAYGNHAFRDEEQPAYGIQFHPEYGRDMANRLMEDKKLSVETEAAIRETFTPENIEAARESRHVFYSFLRDI